MNQCFTGSLIPAYRRDFRGINQSTPRQLRGGSEILATKKLRSFEFRVATLPPAIHIVFHNASSQATDDTSKGRKV
jgi:hypothetical protein